MNKIIAVNVNANISKDQFNQLMERISQEKRIRIKKFYHLMDLKRSLIADILVRCEIRKKVGLLNQAINFEVNSYGKPYLKGIDDFYFNISHAGDWVVIACDHATLGVDIEEIKPVDLAIAKRFFSNEEYKDLIAIEKASQLDYFYKLWALKESFIKAVGRGLSIPLDAFSFKLNGDDIKISFNTVEDYTNKNYYFKMYNIDAKYQMALCTSQRDASPEEVNLINLNDLYDEAIQLLSPICKI
ncbi:4'-phosphopantetheinyl transferase family protein [Alkaliphilus transvaalensis]|uniref:4'-phosphopantetheinyl transferase family protein n=1 Tax=Alkaliphilus transvaalensis TaxID=114628 RepID=UPI00054D14C8|nr:4'-phosphopantetheinyl transferase superfamily protein [Alkaliphilus transvaalensis]